MPLRHVPPRRHRPARRRQLAAERGSILVEVLIGTILLALTTTAVLNGVDGAQDVGRMNKDRSTSATLAQQDLERLRSLPPAVLSNLKQTRTVPIEGVSYTVVSGTDWVRDASGLVSCTSDETEAEYLKLTSTAYAPASADRPVSATSLLTPPPGAFADDTGTAAVRLTDRDGEPLVGVDVDLEGPDSLSGTTNEVGCAIFGFIPADDWTAVVETGLVTWAGEDPAQSPLTVAAGKTNLTQLQLDQPASLRASLQTPTGAVAQWGSISVTNPKLPNGLKPFGTGALASSHDTEGLFPFYDGYNVYAGTCEANNPAVWDSDYFQTSGFGHAELSPGELLEPVNAVMPLLQVKVRQSGNPVDARVTVTQRDSSFDCTDTIYDTAALGTSTGADGDIDIALPWGHYRVCASYSGQRRRTSSSSPQDPNLTSAVVHPLTLNLNTSGGCP